MVDSTTAPFRYEHNYDGDTITGQVQVSFEGRLIGFGLDLSGALWLPIVVRVLGVDTEEMASKSAKAKQAQAFTEQWCRAGQAADGLIVLTAWKREKYGRLLAYVQRAETGEDLAERLIETGLGKSYSGGKRG